MKLSPIKDIEVPYFRNGQKAGTIRLERGFEEEVTLLRNQHGTVMLRLEEEPDKIECAVPSKFVHLY